MAAFEKIVLFDCCLISSQHQSCGGGVEQAGRVRGKDAQPAEEDPVRRHGQLPDQAGQWPPRLLVSASYPAGSCASGVSQHLHCLLPLLLPDPGSAVGMPLWPAQLPRPGMIFTSTSTFLNLKIRDPWKYFLGCWKNIRKVKKRYKHFNFVVLLFQDIAEANFRTSSSRLLAAVMSALCNTSVKLTSILPIAYDGEVLLRSLVKQVSTENDSALAHRFPLLVAHMEKLSHVSGPCHKCASGIFISKWWLVLLMELYGLLLLLKNFEYLFAPADGGEPDGHDQFSRGTGEDAGDCGVASEEEFEEGGGALLSTPGLQHLWSAGLHRLWAHGLCPWLWGNYTHMPQTNTSIRHVYGDAVLLKSKLLYSLKSWR